MIDGNNNKMMIVNLFDMLANTNVPHKVGQRSSKFDIVCLPQQLWSLKLPFPETWTIFCPHNNWDSKKLIEFKKFVINNRKYIIFVEELLISDNLPVLLPKILCEGLARVIFFFKRLKL